MKKLLIFLLGLLLSLEGTAQIKIQKVKRTYLGVTQRGLARRDMGLYPSTTNGNTDFFAAVNAGCISVTIAGGVVTPIEASCPGSSVGVPSWLTALQYKHDGTTLTVQAGGDVSTIAFNTAPASAFSASNPDGVVINSGIDYPYGPISNGNYSRQWQLNKGATTYVLTLKNGSGQSYSKTFTALVGSTFTALVGTAVQPSGPPIVTPPTPTTSAGGSFYAGYGEGTLSQLMAFAPFVPANNQIGSWMVGNTTQYVTTPSGLKFGINNAIGGSMTHLSLNGGENLINTTTQRQSYFRGVLSPDDGRSEGFSVYAFPDGFRGGTNGRFVAKDTSGVLRTSSAIGYNLVMGGEDDNANRGIIHFYERRNVPGYGDVLYIKNQTFQWGMRGVLGQQYVHYWRWGEGQAVGWYVIIENFRDDGQGLDQAREQESPFVFPIATYYRKMAYVGSQPGSFGALSEFTKAEPCEGAGQPGCPNANDTGDWLSSEYWGAGMKGDGSMLVANVTPYNTRFRGKQEQSHSGNEFTNATSYVNAAVMMNFDEPLTRAFSGYIYAGSPSDFRNWYNTKNLATTPFSWDFSGGSTHRWWSENGPAKKISGRYTFNYGFGRPGDIGTPLQGTTVHFAAFASPHGAWEAADIPKIYIKGVFTGGGSVTQFKLRWRKPGISEGATEYEKTFSIQPTTNEQTIELDMTGESNWNGIISLVRFHMADFLQATAGNEMFIPTYIGRVNPNGAADWQALLTLAFGLGTAFNRRHSKRAVRDCKPVTMTRPRTALDRRIRT